jgi:hypothetical protein
VENRTGASFSSGDLEYDLAHEAVGAADEPARPRDEIEQVPTATPDYDGDYSYDLAHDVRRG